MSLKPASISGYIQYVTDVAKTTKFYEKLGFMIVDKENDFAKVRINWFTVEFIQKEKAEETIFAKDKEKDNNNIGGDGLYILVRVANVDEFYKGVIDIGLKPISAPKDFRWGRREFILRDPDGYKLVFFTKTNKKGA